jgi:RimJ/RimL family protein N-acetyltransferase
MSQPDFANLSSLPDELRGPRVQLRAYRTEDAPAVFAAVEESREHLRPWMPWVGAHRTLADSRTFVTSSAAQWLTRENLNVGVWEAASGRYLGSSGLEPRDWRVPSFEIGYWVRVTAEGKGYATEAVRLLTELAFDRLGANRVEIRCDARNLRSAAVAKRLGYVLEARLRNHELAPDGSLRDTLVFALKPADWQSARATLPVG